MLPNLDKFQFQQKAVNIAVSSFQNSAAIKQEPATWEPMQDEAKFILLYAVDAYLTNDFQHSLFIATLDFKPILVDTDTKNLFEGNLKRVQALASLKLFEHGLDDQEKDQQENQEYLTTAI